MQDQKLLNKNLKKSFVWNTLAGLLNSFQLFLLLLIIPRTNGQEVAGVVSGAFAIGNLVMAIGKYGMRNYQVSDVEYKYSDRVYYVSRIITNLIMILAFLGYGCILFMQGAYTFEKLLVVYLVCFLKALDAYEDVFHGMMQRDNCFEIASKAMALRLFVTIGIEILLLIITRDVIISFVVSLVISIVIFVLLTLNPSKKYWRGKSTDFAQVKELLMECLPLGLWYFVNMYMGNFPKYAVDAYLSETVQGAFNYIFMPVFTINLLNTFIFQPLMTKVSIYWKEGILNKFVKVIMFQFFLILGITVTAVVLGYYLGIPVLNIVFAADLAEYKYVLVFSLLSGGLLAITSLFAMVLTVLREQKKILVSYAVSAIVAYLLQEVTIVRYGELGIVLLYLAVLVGLAIVLGIILFLRINQKKLEQI